MNITQDYLDKAATKPITGAIRELQHNIKQELHNTESVLVEFTYMDGRKKKCRPVVFAVVNHLSHNKVKTTTGDIYEVIKKNGNLHGNPYQYLARV